MSLSEAGVGVLVGSGASVPSSRVGRGVRDKRGVAVACGTSVGMITGGGWSCSTSAGSISSRIGAWVSSSDGTVTSCWRGMLPSFRSTEVETPTGCAFVVATDTDSPVASTTTAALVPASRWTLLTLSSTRLSLRVDATMKSGSASVALAIATMPVCWSSRISLATVSSRAKLRTPTTFPAPNAVMLTGTVAAPVTRIEP